MNIAFILFSSSDNLPCHPMIKLIQCNESFQLRICKQIGTEERLRLMNDYNILKKNDRIILFELSYR